jgi:rRNA-processing protein EBP2
MAGKSKAVNSVKKQSAKSAKASNTSKAEKVTKKSVKKQEPVVEDKEEEESDDDEYEDAQEGSDSDDDDEDEDNEEIDIAALNESEGDEDEDEEAEQDQEEEEEEEEEAEQVKEDAEAEEEDVPLSEAEFDSDADVVPHTKLTVNNKIALKDSLARIQIDWDAYAFSEGQALTYHSNVESEIKDIYDDTERELAFFKQGLDAALEGRRKLLALKVPFARPVDYFAEMVKSDEHMDKLKAQLISEATEKKAREEARRQRQLKKFGKQVQHETLQQRQKEKRETLDKIKSMKKKRGNNEMSGGDDGFDIAVEEATKVGSGKQREKKQKIRQTVSSRSQSKPKSRPGKNRRRNKR